MKSTLTLSLVASCVLSACAWFDPAPTPADAMPKPAVAPVVASPAATPMPAPVDPDAPVRTLATFKGTASTIEGGPVAAYSYSEKKGDASNSAPTLLGDMLNVTGQFSAQGHSAWGGVAVSVASPKSIPVKAGDYKFLTIKLASSTANKLRVRIAGPDEAVVKLGCYPIVMQSVTAEVTEYRIPLERFVPDGYCGNKGISGKVTLAGMTSIEIAEVASPVKDRAVNFSVGSIALAR